MKDKCYTIKEFCKLAKISSRTLYRWIKNKKIEAFKMGSLWRIPYYELPSFLRQEKEE